MPALARKPHLIAFDDFACAPLLATALTVVRQPIARMMEATLTTLFRQIDGDSAAESQTISIPGELIIRQSCGCPCPQRKGICQPKQSAAWSPQLTRSPIYLATLSRLDIRLRTGAQLSR